MTDLIRYDAADLVRAYADGSVSPVEATHAALDAIRRFDGVVHAFVLVDDDRALEQARASEARWRSGSPLSPVDGIPTTIKDILLTRGWPTLRGSHLIHASGPWSDDAPSVARLREAGAVFLGKTTTPEFGWKGVTDSPRFGVTGNPWAPDRTAGGSSGGSAAAVALGIGTWSLGTDGGGSVRIPAGFTGTTALKPTYGLVPAYPASPFGTLSHVGPMTRNVRDAALLLDVITGFDERDWSAMPTPSSSFIDQLDAGVSGMRIAYSRNLGYVENDPEVERLVDDAAAVFTDLGAQVEPVEPGFGDPVEAFRVLWFSGVAKVLDAYPSSDVERADPGLRAAAVWGTTFSASDYLDAVAVRMDIGRRMGTLHRDFDVLLTPSLPITAFETGKDVPTGWDGPDWPTWTPYTYPLNMTQQPGLSVPCGLSKSGLPVGLHIVGPRHGDATVLRAGHAFQQATSWHELVPTLVRT